MTPRKPTRILIGIDYGKPGGDHTAKVYGRVENGKILIEKVRTIPRPRHKAEAQVTRSPYEDQRAGAAAPLSPDLSEYARLVEMVLHDADLIQSEREMIARALRFRANASEKVIAMAIGDHNESMTDKGMKNWITSKTRARAVLVALNGADK